MQKYLDSFDSIEEVRRAVQILSLIAVYYSSDELYPALPSLYICCNISNSKFSRCGSGDELEDKTVKALLQWISKLLNGCRTIAIWCEMVNIEYNPRVTRMNFINSLIGILVKCIVEYETNKS